MATTRTDDPLDSTVGVHGYLDQHIFKSLKREALLFDQIAIPPRTPEVPSEAAEIVGHMVAVPYYVRFRELGNK